MASADPLELPHPKNHFLRGGILFIEVLPLKGRSEIIPFKVTTGFPKFLKLPVFPWFSWVIHGPFDGTEGQHFDVRLLESVSIPFFKKLLS